MNADCNKHPTCATRAPLWVCYCSGVWHFGDFKYWTWSACEPHPPTGGWGSSAFTSCAVTGSRRVFLGFFFSVRVDILNLLFVGNCRPCSAAASLSGVFSGKSWRHESGVMGFHHTVGFRGCAPLFVRLSLSPPFSGFFDVWMKMIPSLQRPAASSPYFHIHTIIQWLWGHFITYCSLLSVGLAVFCSVQEQHRRVPFVTVALLTALFITSNSH